MGLGSGFYRFGDAKEFFSCSFCSLGFPWFCQFRVIRLLFLFPFFFLFIHSSILPVVNSV